MSRDLEYAISELHRRPRCVRADDDLGQVFATLDAAAHRVLVLRKLEDAASHVAVRHADGGAHVADREVEGLETHRIDLDLVLLLVAPEVATSATPASAAAE